VVLITQPIQSAGVLRCNIPAWPHIDQSKCRPRECTHLEFASGGSDLHPGSCFWNTSSEAEKIVIW
jgi:hypothetical protein